MITRIRSWIRVDDAEAGYNLIGVSLFIVVLGIFTAAGISLKQQYDWTKRQEITATNMALVKKSLENYRALSGRLPCAASLSDPLDNPAFGREADCAGAVVAGTFRDAGRGGRTIRYGAVPVRTLGLPDTAIVDGWGHRLVYAVTEYYAGPAEMIDPHGDNGAISIIDANGVSATSTPGNIVYTVVSPGADQRGAYTLAGVRIDDCAGTNCVDAAGDGTLQLSIFRQYNTSNGVANNDFTATMTYAASDVSFEWFAEDNWSACNCVAGATQTRTTAAVCRVRGSEAAAPGMCPASTMPPTTKSCAAFCWNADAFPACPSGCGQPATTQTRVVECRENTVKAVPDSLCAPVVKPASSNECAATGACPPPSSGGSGSNCTAICSTVTHEFNSNGTTTWTTTHYSDSGSSTSSSSTSSVGSCCMVVTHFYRRKKFSRAEWLINKRDAMSGRMWKVTLAGYHVWAPWAVRMARKNRIAESILFYLFSARTRVLAKYQRRNVELRFGDNLCRLALEVPSTIIGILGFRTNLDMVYPTIYGTDEDRKLVRQGFYVREPVGVIGW